MSKLWEGRFSKGLDAQAEDFNSSIRVCSRMYREDIKGSMAHAAMLGAQGIIPEADAGAITAGLSSILSDIDSGALSIDASAEDIHSFVEAELTRRTGDAGKRLHTARSRNDQVALDTRLYLLGRCDEIKDKLKALIRVITDRAEQYKSAVMPGYTHMQRAQPITFGHQLMAYAMMLLRDIGRLDDAAARMSFSPLGAGALAGTTYNIDRNATAAALGLRGPCQNSIDAVSDRDFCVELGAALSLVMTHLSRFSEEIILWSGREFGFIELSDEFSTGSSIMPQKKNPDMAELVRGKTGRVYGDLFALLTMLKGLPLAYNKDMQEDKEAIFDACDTVSACLSVFAPMLETMTVHPETLRKAAAEGFINATDLADYLVKKGLPFRDAYKLVGAIVARCIKRGETLESMTPEAYAEFSELFDSELYDAINLENCVMRRTSLGGAAPQSVQAQIDAVREAIA